MKPFIMTTILVLILGLGCVQEAKPTPVVIEINLNQIHVHTIFEKHAQANGQTKYESQQFFAQNYQLDSENSIFDQLDTPPPDYEEEKNWMYDGNSESLGWISQETYQQPEFYPTFSTSGINAWVKAPATLQFSMGLIGTPAKQITALPPGKKEFSTYLFVGSSWGVTARQAGSLHYDIEPDANITIDFSPNTFFLGKSFPVFEKGWVERIHLRGTINENVEPGTYYITVLATPPNPEVEWNPAEYYPVDNTFFPEDGLANLQLTVLP